jgi:hypothetical protein|tara:strand:- start:1222 stop:1689 length:468 start_codon:yes stop_codon:yes gene_type:complete
MNWEVIPQEATINKETVEVAVKNIAWRPASAKEQAAGSGEFKRLGKPTFRILFKHVKGDGQFKLVAQLVKGQWRVNLHDPDIEKPADMMWRNRVTCVSMAHPTKRQIIKKSTGTSPYASFFGRVFGERIRDAAFRVHVQQLLDEAISEREQAAAA